LSKTLKIILFIAFTNAVSFTILIPILYPYGQAFGLDDKQTSWLFAIYAVSQFLATPVIGKLSDRFGRKPLLMISLAGTAIASFLAFFAGTLPSSIMGIAVVLLFFARFCDGITGGNVSVIQAVIADITQPQDRAKAFGLFGAVSFGLGFTLGPIFSLVAQEAAKALGYTGRTALGAGFLASSCLATTALILTIVALPESLKERPESTGNIFDIGLGNLVSGLRMPKLGVLFMINFLIGTTFTIFTFGFQPYFIKRLEQPNENLIWLFVLFGMIGTLVQAKGLGMLNQRLSLTRVLSLGLLMRGVTFLLMPLFPVVFYLPKTESVIYFIVVSTIFSIFNSLVQPTVTTLISLNAKPEVQGVALGVNASYLNVSNALGPVIAGLIVNAKDPNSYSNPLLLAGVLTLSVMLLAIYTRDRYAIAKAH
jgi:MFS family permease